MSNSKLFQWMMCYALRMNENRLSDMVWALCQADREFLVFFFNYIFDLQKEEIDVYFVEREAIQAGGRNDFLFYTSNGYYILESKINDTTINASNYLGYVNNEQSRIRYILAYDNEGRYGSDWIVDKEKHLLEIDYCGELGSVCSISYKLWSELAQKLIKDGSSPDWKLLGAIIIQALYQKDCNDLIEQFKKFSFNEEITMNQSEKGDAPIMPSSGLHCFNDNWENGGDIGGYLDEDHVIWYGYVYMPTRNEGTVHVLAVKDVDFKKQFAKCKEYPIFKNLTPIGIRNAPERWYYFKIEGDNPDKAYDELKSFMKKEYEHEGKN